MGNNKTLLLVIAGLVVASVIQSGPSLPTPPTGTSIPDIRQSKGDASSPPQEDNHNDEPHHLVSSPFQQQNHLHKHRLGISRLASNFADVRHCNLTLINTTSFHEFRDAVLQQVKHSIAQKHYDDYTMRTLHDDVTLQVLERFALATHCCDLAYYKPSIPRIDNLREVQQTIFKIPSTTAPTMARCVFIISVHSDLQQVQELLQAIHMPHHVIVLHVERQVDPDFLQQLQNVLQRDYANVVLLRYGSVVYGTDSLSQYFLQIMRFIHQESQLQYDYIFTLGANAFPLWTAPAMARHLKQERKRIFMGSMSFDTNKTRYCKQKLLTLGATQGRKRLFAVNLWKFAQGLQHIPPIEDFGLVNKYLAYCTLKANSGNTAAYDYDAVEALLSSQAALEFLSIFKTAGSSANEEASWAAAMNIIGRKKQVLQVGAMWQVWPCRGLPLQNSVLYNKTECVIAYDIAGGFVSGGRKIHNLEQELREAKNRGHLFARKFVSHDPYWRDWIKANLLVDHEVREE
jgi:hypothetical protein